MKVLKREKKNKHVTEKLSDIRVSNPKPDWWETRINICSITQVWECSLSDCKTVHFLSSVITMQFNVSPSQICHGNDGEKMSESDTYSATGMSMNSISTQKRNKKYCFFFITTKSITYLQWLANSKATSSQLLIALHDPRLTCSSWWQDL